MAVAKHPFRTGHFPLAVVDANELVLCEILWA
jgi:hypothetical protein